MRSLAKAALDGALLESALDAAIDGIVMMDDEGRIVLFNSAAERMFGYRRDEVEGASVAILATEPHRSSHDRYLHGYLDTGLGRIIGVGGRRLPARRKDGSEFQIELGVSEARLGGRRVFLGMIRDISHAAAHQTALADVMAQLQAVADTLVDGFITIDAKGTVAYVNRAVEQMFGYPAVEILGRNVSMLMPEQTARAHDGYIARYRSTGQRRIIGAARPVVARRKDGSTFPMELAVSETQVSGQRMFAGVLRDVSDRVAQEAMRERLLAELQASNRELDDFAYIASHDLKEPLRGVANQARFLMEDHGDQLPQEGLRRLVRMQALCGRMESLINSLLSYARLGRQDLAFGETDLAGVIAELRQLLGPYLEDHGARLEVVTPLPTLSCDRWRVSELLQNLIVNGVKYNRSDRKLIQVGCTADAADGYRFFVRDNGIGIDPRFHRDVFKIFKRLDSDPGDGGTGSGLTFAQRIVERHGGRIWIESAPGAGTTVHFTLQAPAP
ncbi:MAG: PAS domain S-box protein [Rhodospirillaceae bacterium]|nr:PAS domain S-box protein [Rhodospirillaceae bacterium]